MIKTTYLKTTILILIITILFATTLSSISLAYKEKPAKGETELLMVERNTLFSKMENLTGIPWHYFAAIDQYERTMNFVNKNRPKKHGPVAIYIPSYQWSGALNPNQQDTRQDSIAFFGGIGKDGNADGKVDQNDNEDILYTLAHHILSFGTTMEDFGIALWEYYGNSRSVDRILQFAKIYDTFHKLDLFEKSFIVPRRSDYSYRSTWGARRGWGGYRIHEGTDIFASYGVPVLSSCYGYVEIKGWNPYGGWRIGIRDLNNVYYYYAHLSGFNKKIKEGDVVKPGDILGWVGSSGYGKPGTSGKFPPHLHFGMYRDNGYVDWSFDPYPYLRRWERQTRSKY
jgi:murein DD-endopeptidase MepM/ murein hydrolase activator NlpD